MWQHYLQPTTLDEALRLLDEHAGRARIVAGGTDVLVELQRGVKPTETLIDITRLRELKYVRADGDAIRLGALATHNDVIASSECIAHALPLTQACWEVGAPQIRTRATVAGNLITASPANDTITPLMALDAELLLVSATGERIVPLREFYPGFRRTVLHPNELLREIRIPKLHANQRGFYIKLGLRRAQAISVIDLAFVLTFEDKEQRTKDKEQTIDTQPSILHSPFSILHSVTDARIALGSLAPTITRAATAEAFLRGKPLTPEVCAEAGRLACADAAPIDDVRGSAAYRTATLAALIAHGLQRIADGTERVGMPERAVLLETKDEGRRMKDSRSDAFDKAIISTDAASIVYRSSSIVNIQTIINGTPRELKGAYGKSLLNALREDAGLTGTKEGCAEGECGACTVWLDGQAVMACLVPAAQAHGAQVTTIEGLAETRRQGDRETRSNGQQTRDDGALHPLQQAFIEHAAVQCGYCIPGFLMAGAKLLQEIKQPTREQAQVALSGNICRCTGYRKILDAVLAAGSDERQTTNDECSTQASSSSVLRPLSQEGAL